MKKLNIALLAGGNSSEREVALASAAMILDAFDRSRYNVIPVDVHGLHWTCKGAGDRKVEVDKTDFSVPVGDGKIRFDYAFIMIHGTPGEDGKLQGYLEMMGIPYSTSGFVSSVETFDKTLCKRIVSEIDGLCLAREVLLRRGDRVDADAIAARLGLPVFVKPNASGSSCGVTKVKSVADMAPAIERAFTESDAVLIEEFIKGQGVRLRRLDNCRRNPGASRNGNQVAQRVFRLRGEIYRGDVGRNHAGGDSRRSNGPDTAARRSGGQGMQLPRNRTRRLHHDSHRGYIYGGNQLRPRHERRKHRTQTDSRGRPEHDGSDKRRYRRYPMQALIEIEGRIVVTDILTERFCCDLAACRGMCCVEGNAGAPLEKEELAVLEREYERFSPYMTEEGRQAVAQQGFFVIDGDGDYTTPLIGDADCAYACRENGTTLCAIEKAWREGRTAFRKPVSCHLYPIRVTKFSDGSEGLHYHRWDICAPARRYGRKTGIRVYESLREPIIRKFGAEFYKELDAAAKYMEKEYRTE